MARSAFSKASSAPTNHDAANSKDVKPAYTRNITDFSSCCFLKPAHLAGFENGEDFVAARGPAHGCPVPLDGKLHPRPHEPTRLVLYSDRPSVVSRHCSCILGSVSQLQTFEFDGCRFAYGVDGQGPPLVMIQGVGAHGTAYNPQVEILKAHYTCLTFDNRGIGASQPAARKLTVNQMARDSLALMDHLGWGSAHIVGHSLGGLISLELALM